MKLKIVLYLNKQCEHIEIKLGDINNRFYYSVQISNKKWRKATNKQSTRRKKNIHTFLS